MFSTRSRKIKMPGSAYIDIDIERFMPTEKTFTFNFMIGEASAIKNPEKYSLRSLPPLYRYQKKRYLRGDTAGSAAGRSPTV